MPKDFQAELIGGTVYVASPLRRRHSTTHLLLGSFLAYVGDTSGVEAGDNATILLDDDSESQPDLYLRILPEDGGQSQTTPSDYVKGAPELIAEIAHSNQAIDLYAKHDDYARHGVLEYVVVCLREGVVRWFDMKANRVLQPDRDGVIRISAFPGLWIHPAALLQRDFAPMMKTLEEGLATAEHGDFLKRLQSRHSPGN